MKRPEFEHIRSGAEFNSWYWLKSELVDICKRSGLPSSGRKFDLRDRIMYALDHDGSQKPESPLPKPKSTFDWAKEELSLETVITDNVSFGPNFRRFMKSQIGKPFSCHRDFMDWVKAHAGKTLGDAVQQWRIFEQRKKDPDFQRAIEDNNMYNQYIRTFLADNPGQPLKAARKYWMLKKSPTYLNRLCEIRGERPTSLSTGISGHGFSPLHN